MRRHTLYLCIYLFIYLIVRYYYYYLEKNTALLSYYLVSLSCDYNLLLSSCRGRVVTNVRTCDPIPLHTCICKRCNNICLYYTSGRFPEILQLPSIKDPAMAVCRKFCTLCLPENSEMTIFRKSCNSCFPDNLQSPSSINPAIAVF